MSAGDGLNNCVECHANNLYIEMEILGPDKAGRVFFYMMCKKCGLTGNLAPDQKEAILVWNQIPAHPTRSL